MRGSTARQITMLSSVTPDQLIPVGHPIRRIKPIVEAALARLEPTFAQMYAEAGRPSIPPEHLLKASLLMAFYSIRSERQFCERLQYDLLFKWFLDLNVEDEAFDHSSFSKNQERLLEHEVARAFFRAVLEQAKGQHLLSREHFTVDGTLLESWASLKSLKPRPNLGGQRKPKRPRGGGRPGGGRNAEVDYRGQKRSNQTHYSPTDEHAKLARKGIGKEAKLALAGHVLMENRNGLVVDVDICSPSGKAEREAGIRMLKRFRRQQPKGRVTVGADKGYDTADFVGDCRGLQVTPHVAQNQSGRRSAIDGRVATQPGYEVSQRIRKRVEEIFGWLKTVGGGRKRNQHWAEMATSAFNLVRMANLALQAG